MKIIRAAVVLLSLSVLYILTQRPKVWCDTQWAGVALTRGGYRSWTASFCDGQTWIDGKLVPVVFTKDGIRQGHYRWPKFGHVDVRKMTFQK